MVIHICYHPLGSRCVNKWFKWRVHFAWSW